MLIFEQTQGNYSACYTENTRTGNWILCMGEPNRSIIKVECYSGYRSEEIPVRFYLGERCVEVMEVLDRWLDPAYRYFKLRGDDNGIYILRHSTSDDTWELKFYNSNTKTDSRLSST